MTRYYRRRKPGSDESLRAAAIGVGVGLAAAASAFYLARLFMGREILGFPSDRRIDPGTGEEARPRTGAPARPRRISGRTGRMDGS